MSLANGAAIERGIVQRKEAAVREKAPVAGRDGNADPPLILV
jgi:hypothetical protein